jgi:hypothetical protein
MEHGEKRKCLGGHTTIKSSSIFENIDSEMVGLCIIVIPYKCFIIVTIFGVDDVPLDTYHV